MANPWILEVNLVRERVIRVVDRKKQGWGHVVFDDFSTSGKVEH